MPFEKSKKILIALDYDDQQAALDFVKQLSPDSCRLKVGKEMFTYFGPAFVKELIDLGFDVFLDLKFHDIPNTVAKAVTAAAKMGVWMVNVHASGGFEMMSKAKQALAPFGDKAPLLIAVTVLTSMDETELKRLGVEKTPQEQVIYLAKLAKEAGLDGVVCSAQEAQQLKAELGAGFKLVTPGIRPVGSDAGDQKRIMTPKQAIDAGSDYLVIGRPITQADNPVAVLADVNKSIE
ncbi:MULTISPECIES: orotidine-5'-phosphate decarboxylase [Pseudoalteromonas]|uniref:Orotidine 5'-phosphate decarboxylase n=2 Tax=Pseudoalteromonas TaxID=53246 RepID=PYRF_PSET1|nr:MULTISPECIES: orotidine-5'-phosphate decarboxylase [Pseudoalteromonas]Q3IGA7.1 RecName: Full=Orotidine 5'-phosphate decarboxylase; AltName: Full=OMP decarboxylase; Short=OMPDCase; Short=OMPdecase [Pseudoalteromonas translucida TAC125]ASM53985.1 orotidine-5'-phosphate decarboxylase [Pseudoalteromonas nigrifaciens]MBB1404418.1 orotidine-5'-phosphate decarboxylase [Pseudoalteromonas sp. SG44-5]MBH0093365.1 orotidine-5'-phosphate decarboxylase [Pseudoalteromonas sp. SCQQ13]NYR10922.1 orotidine-|tara:strand:+ start:6317 stop:7021 length:705 start_codon:yes stop_codon:yes gene_type:complete